MPGAILTFFGGWWARLCAGLSAAPSANAKQGDEMPERARENPAAPVPRERELLDPAAIEASFRETVGLAGDAAAAAPSRRVDENLREQVLQSLSELRQIPALQSLVTGFVRAMNRTDVTVDEVVAAIENDAALCVRVLQMANSAAVSPAERIEDLATAVQMLGVVRVRRVVQAVFTLRDARQMTDGLDWRHLWIHAFATAAIAEELERRLRPGGDSAVHLAALLHDVGKIALATVAAESYREILVAAWKGEGRLEELERTRLGVDHREAGVVFGKSNQLPAAVMAAIAHHATPEAATEHRLEVAFVALANYLSKAYGLGFSGARLDEADGEFEDLSAWRSVTDELGGAPDAEMLREELAEFIGTLRAELRSLREAA